jgi:chemotaxis protein MotB
MTFADLMSLLLAFFVLLFSFSELDKLKYKQVAGSMRDAFGVQKEVKVKEPPKGVNVIAQEFSAGTPTQTPLNVVRQQTTDDYHQYLQLPRISDPDKQVSSAPEHNEHLLKPEDTDTKLAELGERIRGLLGKEIDEGFVEVDIEDPRIIIRVLERGSFTSGSTELIEPFRSIMAKMAQAIVISPGNVVVAGHTDNVPISNRRFRSNWELSASRAVTVVHVLMGLSKLPAGRFRIEGYADTQPIDTNNSPEGRARNRRVEVTLLYDDKLAMSMEAEQAGSAGLKRSGKEMAMTASHDKAVAQSPQVQTP